MHLVYDLCKYVTQNQASLLSNELPFFDLSQHILTPVLGIAIYQNIHKNIQHTPFKFRQS